ncbi:MAG: DUF1163 domain-containing protein [Clostridiales bacterium]|nr:DUF1163 domain-containing protein [Clostridiales bacterium]
MKSKKKVAFLRRFWYTDCRSRSAAGSGSLHTQ